MFNDTLKSEEHELVWLQSADIFLSGNAMQF